MPPDNERAIALRLSQSPIHFRHSPARSSACFHGMP